MEQVSELQCRCYWKDEEVRQLTEAGFEIYPMQWIEVDKKRTCENRLRLCFGSCKVYESTVWMRKLGDNGRLSHRLSSW